MPSPRLHADEVPIDEAMVRALLAAQHPSYAAETLRRVAAGGTDNAVFRLGDTLAVRLPLTPRSVSGLRKEIRWLPHLAPHLTLAVPEIVATGDPGSDYPLPWAIVGWLPGADALTATIEDTTDAAHALGRFVGELAAVSTAGAPAPGTEGFVRGLPLASWDAEFRDALATCSGLLDVEQVRAVWADALAAAPYDGPPVWLHADLTPGNVLLRDGRLAGVLDFGGMAIGDPAYDVTPAWHLLDAHSRPVFRRLVDADDATWRRARGIVVALAVFALPYYRHTNPGMRRIACRGLAEALADTT